MTAMCSNSGKKTKAWRMKLELEQRNGFTAVVVSRWPGFNYSWHFASFCVFLLLLRLLLFGSELIYARLPAYASGAAWLVIA